MAGRGGSGVRPGMLRGGKDEKDGTERKKRARQEKRERERKEMCCYFFGTVQLRKSGFCDVTKGTICTLRSVMNHFSNQLCSSASTSTAGKVSMHYLQLRLAGPVTSLH